MLLCTANSEGEVKHGCSKLGVNYTYLSLTIQSTYILYGDTPQPNTLFSQGLDVVLGYFCTNVDIKLDNVTLSYNGRKHASTKLGGNLCIFSASLQSVFRSVTIANCYIEGGVASHAGGGIAIIIHDTTLVKDQKCLNSTENSINISNTVVTSNITSMPVPNIPLKLARSHYMITRLPTHQLVWCLVETSKLLCSPSLQRRHCFIS